MVQSVLIDLDGFCFGLEKIGETVIWCFTFMLVVLACNTFSGL